MTEAQTTSREARRAEEIANRLETQASFFASRNSSGSLNLSQAYREWGMAEIDSNRDFYGNARFDDGAFQLSAAGQTLQRRFVEVYADRVRDDVEGKLVLPETTPLAQPEMRRTVAGGAPDLTRNQTPQPQSLHDEVRQAQQAGRQRIDAQRKSLEGLTSDAKGATPRAAREARNWQRPTDE